MDNILKRQINLIRQAMNNEVRIILLQRHNNGDSITLNEIVDNINISREEANYHVTILDRSGYVQL